MNIKLIDQLLAQSLLGQITFPEVVMQLAASGIERYHIDLVGLQKMTYDAIGHHATSTFTLNDLPAIPTTLDASAVKQAIKNIQEQAINYKTFLKNIMEAGCCHYEVFISGKKVIYFGRDGSHHIEHFPQK